VSYHNLRQTVADLWRFNAFSNLRPSAVLDFQNKLNFWVTVCKTVHRILSDRCLSVCLSVLSVYPVLCCPVCDLGLLWPNSWMDQDETWHAGRPLPWPQCLRWEPRSPLPKGHSPSPIFGPGLLWPNCWMDQDGTWHGGGHWSGPHCARWERSSPSPKKGQSPQFLAHFSISIVPNSWMHQDTTWYGGRPQPRRLCVDGDPSPKRGQISRERSYPRQCFGLCLLWPSGWMDQDATW